MRTYVSRKKGQSQIKGKFQPRIPRSKKIEQEYGPGKTDILACKKCGLFYWYKSWHHRLSDYPKLKQSKQLKFVLCPACQMIRDKKYEGEIILINVPRIFEKDIRKLVENYGRRAFEADPMDRIISFGEIKAKRVSAKREKGYYSQKEFREVTDIRILTTENQLAKRLAKKINEVYGRKLQVSISYSHQEDVVRIRIEF